MSTPHKWAAVIHAWADGKTVQYKFECGNAWHDAQEPSFCCDGAEWRIKPDALRYRVALFRDQEGNYYTETADSEAKSARQVANPQFCFLLKDWTEYEP